MNVSFDADAIKEIEDGLLKVTDSWANVLNMLNAAPFVNVGYNLYDKQNLIELNKKSIDREGDRVANLRLALGAYREQRSDALNPSEMNSINNSYTPFADLAEMNYSVDYTGSIAAVFVSSNFNINNYDDIHNYKNMDFYKSAERAWSLSEIGSWSTLWTSLIGDDSYAAGIFEASLASVLATMPNVDSVEYKGLEKTAGSLTNIPIDEINGLISAIRKEINELLKGGKNLTDEELIEKIDSLFDPLLDLLEELNRQFIASGAGGIEGLIKMVKAAKGAVQPDVLKRMGSVADMVKYTDWVFTGISKLFTDYTIQLSYLETLKDSMLAQGYGAGLVMKRMNRMEKEYSDHMANTLYYALDEAKKEGLKCIAKPLIKSVPGLSSANVFWGVVSAGTKLVSGDKIGAAKTLAGLEMYDKGLTESFKVYATKISQGWATKEDLAEADKLFHLLRGTKLKEYESLKILAEKEAPGAYEMYCKKYDEISKWSSIDDLLKASGSGRF